MSGYDPDEFYKVLEENKQLRAELTSKEATLAALTAEAQAMPSAEQVTRDCCVEDSPLWYLDKAKRVTAAIEHDRLVFARKAQLEREGMRKALEAGRDVIIWVGDAAYPLVREGDKEGPTLRLKRISEWLAENGPRATKQIDAALGVGKPK